MTGFCSSPLGLNEVVEPFITYRFEPWHLNFDYKCVMGIKISFTTTVSADMMYSRELRTPKEL